MKALKNKNWKEIPFITLALLFISTILFLFMQFVAPFTIGASSESSYLVFYLGGVYAPSLAINHEWWRLITAMFIHIGWMHFALNAVTLFFLGSQIEKLYGHVRFAILYLLSGVLGNIVSFAMSNGSDPSVSAGASTALFGLFAAFAILRFVFPDYPEIVQLAKQYGFFIVINLVFNLFDSSVDMAGHIGGLLGGAFLSYFLGIPNHMQRFSKPIRLLVFILYLLIAAFAIKMGLSKNYG